MSDAIEYAIGFMERVGSNAKSREVCEKAIKAALEARAELSSLRARIKAGERLAAAARDARSWISSYQASNALDAALTAWSEVAREESQS